MKVKKCDKNIVWTYEEYHIKVDNNKMYQRIGGRNYFNSDAMNLCSVFNYYGKIAIHEYWVYVNLGGE